MEELLWQALIKEFKERAEAKGVQFKDDETLDSCLEMYMCYFRDDDNYTIDGYLEDTITNCKEEVFK